MISLHPLMKRDSIVSNKATTLAGLMTGTSFKRGTFTLRATGGWFLQLLLLTCASQPAWIVVSTFALPWIINPGSVITQQKSSLISMAAPQMLLRLKTSTCNTGTAITTLIALIISQFSQPALAPRQT